MIITRDDKEDIYILKEQLSREFEMKDQGQKKYFLGIEVLRSKGCIFISKRKYVLDLLAETCMVDYKPSETPIVANHSLQMIDGEKLADIGQYQRMIGKIIYLFHTQLDITYVVGVVSRLMHQPQIQHMTALMRILRYLKGYKQQGHSIREK